jgi:hypothetical protein
MHVFCRNSLVLVSTAILLSACLSEEEAAGFSQSPGETQSTSDTRSDTSEENQISGSVGDGPIVGSTLTVRQNDGTEIAQLESDGHASYTTTVKTQGKYYALTIDSDGGTDLVTNRPPDFMLVSAVLRPSKHSVANINPFSTFAVVLARRMPGGANAENLERAEQTVISALNFGLDSFAATGPMTAAVDAGNVSEMVKSSESLAEVVRRTRDQMRAAGHSVTGDDVIRRLASDLTDNVIDGRGARNTDDRTAAVSTILSAQVLLESMANELHVYGEDATQAMQAAIEQVSSSAPATRLDELAVTAGMISKARIGLAAAYAVDPDPSVLAMHDLVSDIAPGQTSMLVRAAFPANYRNVLDGAANSIASADQETIDLVNNIARTSGDIAAGNLAPTIDGTPATRVKVGSLYSFTPRASDPDNDPLTFSARGVPSWATFDSSTGQFSGIPTMADVGSSPDIIVSVSDGEFSASLAAFQVTVVAENSAPSISGIPPSAVDAGSNYSFTPTASDPDGNPLTFAISNPPGWVEFDAGTGHLSGIPTNADAGTYDGVVISVTDGEFSASLPAFSLTVSAVAGNSPPRISGTPPASVNAGDSYSFTPTATDADGDALTFSVTGLPSWANFDAGSGRLSGTPGDGDVGLYSNISISVSDGQARDSLPAFSISVEAVSLGSVSLSWNAPTENEDGSALTDLAGYRLYWGTSSGSYPNSVTINNASVTTYVVDNLAPGAYEFVATSFNTSGVESEYSNPAVRVVQ